jgi:isopentenyl-diphosphate delta-isomerase
VTDAARRRLSIELGIEGSDLSRVSEFLYYAELGDGLVEHELDHVVIGRWTGPIAPDPLEVAGTRWVEPEELFAELMVSAERYTAWTRRVVRHAFQHSDALDSESRSR